MLNSCLPLLQQQPRDAPRKNAREFEAYPIYFGLVAGLVVGIVEGFVAGGIGTTVSQAASV